MQPIAPNILSNSEDCFIKKWHATDSNRFYMHCLVCVKYTGTVKQFKTNRKPAPITTVQGTQHRKKTISDHLKTPYHEACVARYKREALQTAGIADSGTALTNMISAQNEKLANLIGRYMKTVYTDAKKLTLSAWSWPSRRRVPI